LLGDVIDLLGGQRTLQAPVSSKLDAHELIMKGLPGAALVNVVRRVRTLKPIEVTRAVGVSLRTLQRRSHAPRARLSREQSGRTWKFAEILAKATAVLGDQTQAERWLAMPAIALDRRRPVDLLSSPAGNELVEQLLGRMEHGVYT
jgi:putative toxin-antitoxin system antitoxin component (TIGR02293 family)